MIGLSDNQLAEVMQGARLAPFDQRPVYLGRVAMKLRGQDIGDGLVHRIVIEIARSIVCYANG
jgi:hypothetical protein